MPRKRKAGSKAVKAKKTDETLADDIAKQSMSVVNVNKQPSQELDLQSLEKEVQQGNQHEIANKRRRKSTVLSQEAVTDTNNMKTVRANFTEAGQQFEMSVDQTVSNEEEQDVEIPYQSDDDSDHEVVLKAAVSELSEEEVDDDLSDAQKLQADELRRQHDEEIRRQRIKQIDLEMKQRLTELQALMDEGGLEQSAEVLRHITGKERKKNIDQQEKQSHQIVQVDSNNSNEEWVDASLTARKDENADIATSKGKQILPYGCNINTNAQFNKRNSINSRSEETIYRSAVPKRASSSSEEDPLNSSDEMGMPKLIDRMLVAERRAVSQVQQPDAAQPGCSYEPTPIQQEGEGAVQQERSTPEARARKMVQEAERAKAKIYSTKGNEVNRFDLNNQYVHSAMVDEDYMVVGADLEENIIRKVALGEYVDFGKLIPKDRVLTEDDGRLQMTVKDGKAFWTPIHESVSIGSFSRWEQAFRVFSNIYTRAHPHRASELIQYNHVIHTIAMTYSWDNVYNYDKDFRIHMGRNPGRSWSIILHQAWAMRLRDRLHKFDNNHFRGHGHGSSPQDRDRVKISEPCRRFNRGKCNFGGGCKYEHRCSYPQCRKFGHGYFSCRKMIADRDRGFNKPQADKSETIKVESSQGAHLVNNNK